MNYLEALQAAIKTGFHCDSIHIETVPVKEEFQGKTVWEGKVEVFELKVHPKAKYCYGWGFDEGKKSEFATVLGIPPINDPRSAVKAYIVSKLKNSK
jgi:hypothetical protein